MTLATSLDWQCQPFAQLKPAQLYSILRLRAEVFVIEQQCIYLDPDGLDAQALHLGAWSDGQLMAYARLLPPGARAPEPVIGRVITAPAARGTGLGHQLNCQPRLVGQATAAQARRATESWPAARAWREAKHLDIVHNRKGRRR